MSIFRETFQDQIKAELEKRQEAMLENNRTSDVIQYLNSRNAWVRMTSSVNVGGSPYLAKNYVLMGGTLNRNQVVVKGAKVDVYSLKSGVGGGNQAYSTKSPGGRDHRLGIRPMPGITNVEIKSKSAYGSLREAVVSFQCWDIKQLEDLEILYMRPGYTVLLEWGWFPYLDNNKKIVTSVPSYYDILSRGKTNRTDIFKALYTKCTKSGGNYDAMFGYVKNYQWSARSDGGYDCQTTIISTGEIIESLKVNYVESDLTKLNSSSTTGDGFLNAEFASQGNLAPNKWKKHYEKNTLAGVWAEAYDKLNEGNALSSNSIFSNKFAKLSLPGLSSVNTNDLENTLSNGSLYQLYITLEAVLEIIEKYVIPKDSSNRPLIELSSYTENYTGRSSTPLLCVAHPLQISVDPTVCVIKSPTWYSTGGVLYAVQASSTVQAQTNQVTQIKDDIVAAAKNILSGNLSSFNDLKDAILQINDQQLYEAVDQALNSTFYLSIENILNEDSSSFGVNDKSTLYQTQINEIINHIKSIWGANNVTTTSKATTTILGVSIPIGLTTTTVAVNKVPSQTQQPSTNFVSLPSAIARIKELDTLPQEYFTDSKGDAELGIIKNIFVNLDFLYQKALDLNIEATDSKEKNEISLYKYLKSIMAAIQPSIGNVSNFEIHVDPVDNKARIIDINYTGNETASNLFNLQVHNTKSVVRNYTLQSQIFPEQSSIVAIGSQVKGGQLGIQNNTMVDFNKNLTDRIIPDKGSPPPAVSTTTKSTVVASNIGSIVYLFGELASYPNTQSQSSTQPVAPSSSTNLNNLYSKCKNNLRDLIVYFQSITASPGANRNIIPIKFSFEMDGIGGLVIGHLFRINDDILPKGYKNTSLAQTVTRISHSLKDGDWITTIEALNVILDRKLTGTKFSDLDLTAIIEESFKNAKESSWIQNVLSSAFSSVSNFFSSVATRFTNKAAIASFGSVSTSVPLGIRPLLDTLAHAEGTAGRSQNNGYDIIIGGRTVNGWTPTTTQDHPDTSTSIRRTGRPSSAAGRYQFVKPTWDSLVAQKLISSRAFNKENQDIGAWKLISGKKFTDKDAAIVYATAKAQIASNQIDVNQNPKFLEFLDKIYNVWASVPNSKGVFTDPKQANNNTPSSVYSIYIAAVSKY